MKYDALNRKWTGRDSSVWTDDVPWDESDDEVMAICRFLRSASTKNDKRSLGQIAKGTGLPLDAVLRVLEKRLMLSRDVNRGVYAARSETA
jgi:hypothetical protein